MSRGRKPSSYQALNNWEDIFWHSLPTYIGILNNYFTKNNYEFVTVEDSLKKLSFTIPKGLNSKEIHSLGKHPVISQSKEYIIGFSDRTELLINKDLPLIVFGDHSKTIKYVDEPFVIGADGVKILKPNSCFNERFFYYFIFGIITDTKDYGRHFSLLRNGLIPKLEDLELQIKVVEFLDALKLNNFPNKNSFFDATIENEIYGLQKNQLLGNSISLELAHQLNLLKIIRQQLLQDAVQAKLIEQDPSDEPANDLLKKIKVERKVKKELPPLKIDEYIFEIPSNWVWCRLGEIAEIVRGGSPRPAGDPTYYGGDIPFLKVGDLTGYEDLYVRNHTYSIKEAGLHKTRFVEANTLMLTNSGATLGIPRICTFPTTFNDGIAAFLNLKYINKEYLYYFLKSKSAWYLKEASKGQGQPNLNTDIIALTPFPLPPLAEQLRIVEKLEELMQYCNDLEVSVKQSESQNKKILQQVLREALRK